MTQDNACVHRRRFVDRRDGFSRFCSVLISEKGNRERLISEEVCLLPVGAYKSRNL